MTWRTELRSLLDIIIGNFSLVFTGKVMLSIKIAGRRKAGVLVFSLEQSSIEGFFEDSTVYEYTPDFEFDKKKAYYNARRNFSEPGNSVWG